MKVKTADLIGPALNWAVAKCEGSDPEIFKYGGMPALRFEYKLYAPSTDWSQGGPIVEREKISVGYERYGAPGGDRWDAVKATATEDGSLWLEYGSTPLIAAMRCLVAATLGDEVDVPDELV